MRNLSIVLTLLLTCATLSAQTATGNNSTILVLPLVSNSCPVGFSVDRRPQGAVIWTSSESDWIKSHGNLSLPELERALKNEHGFSDLSPQAQQDKLDRVAQLYNQQHGQGLNLTFARPANQIVSADIVVHGYSASMHIIPATPSAPSHITETFHLTTSAGHSLFHSAIWTSHISVAKWVELTRLDYADGTTWQSSRPHQCSASPSLYLLVDSAR